MRVIRLLPRSLPDITRTDMRDQYVWKEGDVWYMIIGFGIEQTDTPHGLCWLYKFGRLEEMGFCTFAV